MSLLTDASLIVTPNGYNVNKLYSVIPNTTLGDMAVSRGSSATRVNSAGFIEIARTNNVLYSDDLSQSVWSKTLYALTSTSTIQGLTTTRITKNSANNGAYNGTGARNLINTIGTFAAGTKTLTLLIRKGNTDKVGVLFNNVLVGALTSLSCEFNFNTQTFTNVSLGLTASFENPTTDVYKIILTINDIGVSTSKAIWIAPIDNSNNTFDGGYLDFAFAQWEAGETATEYIPTVASIRTKFAGITQDGLLASNIPRIDYPPLGGCPSILVEPARTNEISYSEEFDNAAWTNNNTIITANATATLAPDGTFTADKFIPNVVNTVHSIYRTTALASYAYTFSVFAKAGEETTFSMWLRNANFGASFDLSTGTIIANSASIIPKIEPYPNGWYRCSVYDATPGTTANIYGRTGSSFQGNNVNGFFIWGAQVEIGTYATSYIPTTTAAVPRAADDIRKTGISSLIGQTEGTLYAEVIIKNTENQICASIQRDGGFNHIFIAQLGNKRQFSIKANSVIIFNYNVGVFLSGTNKVALVYNTNGNIRAYLNGANVSTLSTSAFAFSNTLDSLQIFDDSYYSSQNTTNNKSTILFKTALTDDQCILLTGPSFSSYPEMANNFPNTLIYSLQ